MLQANPNLTPQEVKDIIIQTRIKDNYTGTIPAEGNNNWGHGKINAYRALKQITQGQAGIYVFAGKKLDVLLYPNPNNGEFTLEYITEVKETLKLELFNTLGEKVFSQNWETIYGQNFKTLNLTTLPKGLFMLKLSSPNGICTIKTKID
jgi:hypothetical protein